ncbi:preprotein translocase subunit SecF [Vibrio cholerae]|nr:preprotein translocase subunit SecF [Vibrio cholerae]
MVTSGTTLMTISALWLMGGAPLQGFAIAMFIGILYWLYLYLKILNLLFC